MHRGWSRATLVALFAGAIALLFYTTWFAPWVTVEMGDISGTTHVAQLGWDVAWCAADGSKCTMADRIDYQPTPCTRAATLFATCLVIATVCAGVLLAIHLLATGKAVRVGRPIPLHVLTQLQVVSAILFCFTFTGLAGLLSWRIDCVPLWKTMQQAKSLWPMDEPRLTGVAIATLIVLLVGWELSMATICMLRCTIRARRARARPAPLPTPVLAWATAAAPLDNGDLAIVV